MSGSQDTDLHHSITLRPHPFHQHPPPQPQTSSTYLPVLGPSEFAPAARPKQSGTTSAVETMQPDESARQRPVYQSRNSHEEGDVERGNSLPAYSDDNDPYSLRHGLISDEDIMIIKANTGKKRSAVTCGLGKNPADLVRARRLQGFYEQQNENIERLLKPVDEHVRMHMY